MLIAIDIGNTSTTVGVYKGEALVARGFFDTGAGVCCERFLDDNGIDAEAVEGVIIASVVPRLDEAYRKWSGGRLGIEPVFVDHANAGIGIDYPNPAEIGADRLANAVAGFAKYRSALIIVDLGTATTFDYIDPQGRYCGGAIAPGIRIANEALSSRTSKLPRVDIAKTSSVIAKSTAEAMRAGVYHGYLGLVERLLKDMKREAGTDPKVIATGGLAGMIAGELGIPVEPDLTLDGLRLIASMSLRAKRSNPVSAT